MADGVIGRIASGTVMTPELLKAMVKAHLAGEPPVLWLEASRQLADSEKLKLKWPRDLSRA